VAVPPAPPPRYGVGYDHGAPVSSRRAYRINLFSTACRNPAGDRLCPAVFCETLLNISTLFHHSNLAVTGNWDRVLRTVTGMECGRTT
jgi:hypothetical protein